MSPNINPPNATMPSDTLAHIGSPRKLDEERDRLLRLLELLPFRELPFVELLLLIRPVRRRDLGREDATRDMDLLIERAFFPALRAVDLIVRAIFSSNNSEYILYCYTIGIGTSSVPGRMEK